MYNPFKIDLDKVISKIEADLLELRKSIEAKCAKSEEVVEPEVEVPPATREEVIERLKKMHQDDELDQLVKCTYFIADNANVILPWYDLYHDRYIAALTKSSGVDKSTWTWEEYDDDDTLLSVMWSYGDHRIVCITNELLIKPMFEFSINGVVVPSDKLDDWFDTLAA